MKRYLPAVVLLLVASGAWPAEAEFRSTVEAATILYDAPSAKSRPMFVLSRGYPVQVVVTVEGWAKVRDASGDMYWAEVKALGPRRTVMVRSTVAAVRSAPEETGPVAFQAARDVLLEFVEEGPAGWVRVRHSNGASGFARVSDLWGA